MHCPRCSGQSELRELVKHGVTLDLCHSCGGLWLDKGELSKIVGQMKQAESELDREFAAQIEEFKRTGNGRHIWPAHFAGITREYCQIEKLANLEQLPTPHGFYVSCLPVKIKDGSAGWCRAVALVPR